MKMTAHSLRAIRLLGLFISSFCFSIAPAADEAANCKFTNGLWWNGQEFVERTFYSVGGIFTLDEPDRVNETLDLAGGYVIPPFAEAHNHDLPADELDEQIGSYLRDGVFYVKIQSSFSTDVERHRHRFNRPDSVDAAFAHAPVTGPGGHPIRIRELFFDRGHYEGIVDSKEELEGLGYVVIEQRNDLDRKLPALFAQRPDFIKFMLSHSEEYELRRDDPEFFGYKGLDPVLAPALVKEAHAAGLRITAHVDTATDFHYAVLAGVDEIAHLPGSREPEVIRSRDAALAAQEGIVVVTTVSLTTKIAEEFPAYYERVMRQHSENLERLKGAGVTIAVGSDMPYRDTSVGEAMLLHGLNVFTNRELLAMWTEITPQTIFPGRRIGRLEPGYEASFLVLGGNPLEDFEQVRNIRLRFKQGRPLDLNKPSDSVAD